jgi:hypothetical protein
VRDRRADVEAAAAEWEVLSLQVLAPITESWSGDRPDMSAGSVWRTRVTRVMTLLMTILRQARWPMRRARRIRKVTGQALAGFVALTNAWETHQRPLTDEDIMEINALKLSAHVWGGIRFRQIDAALTQWEARLEAALETDKRDGADANNRRPTD